MRLLTRAWSIIRHPAFWLAFLLALGVDAYLYGNHYASPAIRSDGWGYYLHLPAIFVHGDPHLTFLNRPDLPADILQYRHNGHWQGLSAHGSGYLDKYTFGPAVLQLPFFLVALAVASLRYASVNGFEMPFQVANALSGACYFGLGTYLSYRACRLRYDRWPSALTVTIVVLATNLLQYAGPDGSYSHIYGYCLLSALVYLTLRRVDGGAPASLPAFIGFGLLIGAAIMVRPTNAVYALLFLVFACGTPFPRLVAGGACAFLASAVGASPQMILWFVTTGQPIYYSYQGEGFHFLAPALWNYLLSIRKGVFFWHPIYLIMIAALLWQLPRRPREGGVALAIVLLGLYIGASWGDFTFGHSFGSRQSVELLPILTLPLAGAIASIQLSRWRWAAGAAIVALTVINLVQFKGYFSHSLPGNNTTALSYVRFWAATLGLPPPAESGAPAGR
jgi:hypothetical protein